ncbi:MAG: FAD-dependent thymidylate synthase, partial [Microbacteriaceae bacterium]|nr:FAD-dependent thymidylate synthase [Microbacteriaceae bacterium]
MSDVQFRSDVTVELVRSTANDRDVLFAARVSTQGEQSLEGNADDATDRDKGLINYLMRDRHGSPFEHNSMTFYVQAPIFVFREFMRHRIASYN